MYSRPVLSVIATLCFSSIGAKSLVAQAHGHVDGNTYADERFGIVYTFPTYLKSQTSMNGVPVGTGTKVGVSEYLFAAMEDPTGQVRRGVFVTSDPIGVFGVHTIPDYLKAMVSASSMKLDFTGILRTNFSGCTFYVAHASPNGPVKIYGAQASTISHGHFVTFWLSGPSAEDVSTLLALLNNAKINCAANSQ